MARNLASAPSKRLRAGRRAKISLAAVLMAATALAVCGGSNLLAQQAGPGDRGERRDGRGDRDGRPTSRPWRGGGMGGGLGGGGGPPGGGRWMDQPAPTPEEWAEVVAFMQENSPVRLDLYRKLETEKGVDTFVVQGVRKRAFSRYKELNNLQGRNAELYDFAFKQFKLEDAVLSTLLKMRRDGESAELTAERDRQVHEFVSNSLDEREARLKKLREFLSREEESLARDRQDMSALEAKQRDHFDRDMKRLLDFAVDADAPATQPAN